MTSQKGEFSGESLPGLEDDNLGKPPTKIEEMIPVDLSEEEEAIFEELLTVGKITKQIKIAGHRVHLSTLTVGLELQVGLLTKPFLNSDAYPRAYKTAVVVGSVEELDGQPVYSPLSPHEDLEHIMREKFARWIEYYPLIVDMIYSEVTKLEQELVPLRDKLLKMLG